MASGSLMMQSFEENLYKLSKRKNHHLKTLHLFPLKPLYFPQQYLEYSFPFSCCSNTTIGNTGKCLPKQGVLCAVSGSSSSSFCQNHLLSERAVIPSCHLQKMPLPSKVFQALCGFPDQTPWQYFFSHNIYVSVKKVILHVQHSHPSLVQ